MVTAMINNDEPLKFLDYQLTIMGLTAQNMPKLQISYYNH